ncbi:hypothetical protein [Pseudomonas vancouverensis]|uniref:Lipoprotein n=1 Tax=Pseudomonas vancouverensis TaxID=95300 RepID=A0A1H2NQN0_PSEVA|nr:hypothetical protein [Pseudomonas vancouverensis]KAB0491211.1 hypothetical protein F7R09_26295 [Pseudomonas vancouverensis]TDB59577.1 hypothetical protein EIY72_18365 [Pseudomonas vancouverensis]SDV07807.1 hypothetical protein SAMN05216558_2782 [Pseudomonas vancouverensis]
MNRRHSLAALMITASLAGCTTSSNSSVNLNLQATRQNPGQIANVTLTDWGHQTGLNFIVSGVPNGAALPLRLYSFIYKGSCEQPGTVAYDLNDKVITERQPIRGWTFSRSAPVPIATLMGGDYSIVVRSAATDGSADLFCGNIKQAAKVQ